jgi:hypothetical protein
MESVLFYAIRGPTPGRPLSTEPPSDLINRDLIFPLMLGTAELKRRGD